MVSAIDVEYAAKFGGFTHRSFYTVHKNYVWGADDSLPQCEGKTINTSAYSGTRPCEAMYVDPGTHRVFNASCRSYPPNFMPLGLEGQWPSSPNAQ